MQVQRHLGQTAAVRRRPICFISARGNHCLGGALMQCLSQTAPPVLPLSELLWWRTRPLTLFNRSSGAVSCQARRVAQSHLITPACASYCLPSRPRMPTTKLMLARSTSDSSAAPIVVVALEWGRQPLIQECGMCAFCVRLWARGPFLGGRLHKLNLHTAKVHAARTR